MEVIPGYALLIAAGQADQIMKKDNIQNARVPIKELIRGQFHEWCSRHSLQVPDRPAELLNDENLTAAQREYVWSVLEFLD